MQLKDWASFVTKWNYLKKNPAFQLAPITTIFRLLAWRIICSLGFSFKTITLHRWDVKLCLPVIWTGVQKDIFVFRDNYEPELKYLEQQIQPGNVIVDVGANLGIYSILAGKLVGDSGKVFAFEPAKATFDFLYKSLSLNSFKNINCYQVGLSESAGRATLYHSSDIGSHSLGQIAGEDSSEEIKITTFDQVVADESLERVDLIKLDVEGAEELVLRGAKMSLSRWRPAIIFEIHPSLTGRLGLQPDGAWNFLAARGYRFYCVSYQGVLQVLNAPPIGNVIALHSTT